MNRLRAFILCAWIIGLGGLLLLGRYSLFIRAELWPLLLATTIMFALLLVSLITRAGRASRSISPAAFLQGAMLMLPLAYMCSTSSGAAASGLNSFALQKRSLGLNNGVASSVDSLTGTAPADANQPMTLSYIIRHPHKLAGTQITTEGRVFKDDTLAPGQTGIYRFMVVCCAADAMPIQAIVQGGDTAGLKADDWVRVTGKLSFVDRDGGSVPVIAAEQVEQVAHPPNPYLKPE